MYVDYSGEVGSGGYNYSVGFYGLRPVVSLKSDVEVEWVQEAGPNSDDGYYKIVGK